MPVYELSTEANPTRTCRLYIEEDRSKYELHESVVEFGRCTLESRSYCALEKTICNAGFGEMFQSSSHLETNGVNSYHSNEGEEIA